jgi:hypothetical protein
MHDQALLVVSCGPLHLRTCDSSRLALSGLSFSVLSLSSLVARLSPSLDSLYSLCRALSLPPSLPSLSKCLSLSLSVSLCRCWCLLFHSLLCLLCLLSLSLSFLAVAHSIDIAIAIAIAIATSIATAIAIAIARRQPKVQRGRGARAVPPAGWQRAG